MRSAFVVAASAAVLVAAAPAGGNGVVRVTPAATPFAQAWANVPASSAARKARKIVIFGAHPGFAGFNTALSCCNQLWAGFAGADETLHGAFNQNNKGEWFKDLVSDAKVTRTTLSYTIKPNAYWYWGGKKIPVTYRDFVYTLQRVDDPNNDLASRAGYANLDPTHFTHKGLRQVTFFWKTSHCSTDFPCGPYAVWQSLFSAAPALYPSFALQGLDFNKIWASCICGFDGKPVSDGPFYLSNFTKDEGTALKANPYWAGHKPRITEVDFKFIADPAAEVVAMQLGQVDAIVPVFGQSLRPLKGVAGIAFDQVPGYVLDHLEFREGNAKAGSSVTKGASNVLLRAPWMREAIALGIDRQKIIDTVYGQLAGGNKPLNNLIFYSTQREYRPDFQRWNYDPRKALAILKAHCTGGPTTPSLTNDKTWQCSGLPATLNWSWKLGIDAWTTTEQIAKAELMSIGIALTEKPFAANVVFGPNGIPSGDFDVTEIAYATSGDPGDWYDAYRCFGDSNFTGYCSHKVDSLLKAANGELDPVQRASLFQRADAVMATQVPMLPLYAQPVPLIHRSDLLGMVNNPGITGPFWNIEDWHWHA